MFAALAFTFALASQAIGAPVLSSVLASVEASLVLPNTTQINNATYYWQNGNAGACGLYSQDTDLVVGLPLEFYNATDSVSPYCGSYVVVANVLNNVTVIARVEDASATSDILSLSVATYRALDGDATNLQVVTWRFANEIEVAEAKASIVSAQFTAQSTVDSASSTVDSVEAIPATTQASVLVAAPVATTTTTTTTTTKSMDYASITAASNAAAASLASAQSVQSVQSAQSASSASAASVSAASAYYASSVSAASVASVASAKSKAAAATTKATTVQASTSSSYSGTATYFYQGGQAGACGNVNSDSAYIVALDSAIYNGGSHCGATVVITGNGKTIQATVADECPTCDSAYSLDLSYGAFTALASTDAGVAAITWYFA